MSKGVQTISRPSLSEVEVVRGVRKWAPLLFVLSRADDLKLFHSLNTQIAYFEYASTHLSKKDFKPGEEFM